MSDTKIATRYAKALYQKAAELGEVERIAADIQSLNTTVAENKDLVTMLQSPLVSKSGKADSLAKIFKGFNPNTIGLVNLMLEKSREALVGEMGNAFMKIYNKDKGIVEAEVTSASDLDASSLSQIEKYVKSQTGAKTVQLKVAVDSNLIGGFKVMFEGKQFDSSIASQINKMKKELNIA